MRKSNTSKAFSVVLVALIILPIAALVFWAITPRYLTFLNNAKDSTVPIKLPGILTEVPDSQIFPPPDPHMLYPVGLTPGTGYAMSVSNYQTVNGFLRKDKLKIYGGPVILLKIDSNTRTICPYNFVNKFTNLVYLKDARRIQVFFHINPQYLSQYRYRVLLNDSTYIQWKQPDTTIFVNDLFPGVSDTLFYQTGGRILDSIKEERKQEKSVLLADVDAYNKKITIQLYNLNNPKGTSTVILYDKPFDRPKLTNLSVNIFKKIRGGRFGSSFNLIDLSSSGKFHSSESTTGVHTNELAEFTLGAYRIAPKEFYAVSIKNLSVAFSKTYEITQDALAKTDMDDLTSSAERWIFNKPKEFIKQPGTYKITVTPTLPAYNLRFPDSATTAEFTVLPASEEVNTYSLTQVLSYLWIFLVITLLVFLWYRTRQKKRQRQYQLQTEITKAQLNAIRLQLNPHFVFNALSGIQNLINKNEIDNANRYLKRFSRLTRSVLDEEFKETISVADEVKLLDDYLKMEQLRFGFEYSFHTDEHIDAENTEIPSMLVQPFVENAVKYGVYQKGPEGVIHIDIVQEDKDIFIRVKDNGAGFDTTKDYEGLGIKLSRSRIDLLNTLQKSTRIVLDLDSGNKGTIVSVRLKDWI